MRATNRTLVFNSEHDAIHVTTPEAEMFAIRDGIGRAIASEGIKK